MPEAIRPLTPEMLRAQARAAAEQCIPLHEANHHEPGTPLWRQFNEAYAQACSAMARDAAHGAARVEAYAQAYEKAYGHACAEIAEVV